MGDHDPLCPSSYGQRTGCECWLIARVEERARADERERHGNNCRGMWDEWLADLRAQVEALAKAHPLFDDGEPTLAGRFAADVLALLGSDDD